MPNIGTGEIVLLLLLALLLFGAKRLPEIGRSLGSGMREFKDSVTGHDDKPEPVQTSQLPVGTEDTSTPSAPPRENETVV
jgi:sec-independent protein translocase protein TatA